MPFNKKRENWLSEIQTQELPGKMKKKKKKEKPMDYGDIHTEYQVNVKTM